MKTSDLTGAELDRWVGLALGGTIGIFHDRSGKDSTEYAGFIPTRKFPGCEEWDLSFARLHMNPKTMDGLDYSFHPSTDSCKGWPLIDKWPHVVFSENGDLKACSLANLEGEDYYGEGPTKLIAAMRAIVASVYGDSVDE